MPSVRNSLNVANQSANPNGLIVVVAVRDGRGKAGNVSVPGDDRRRLTAR
jgi:hypothetical protein